MNLFIFVIYFIRFPLVQILQTSDSRQNAQILHFNP